jgi:DNA repair exonuclease SbcCD nuclease subunit
LFFLKVEEIIREAISIHKIDFIIHSGDFFNRSKPPPKVVDRGVKPFQLAARKGIPVFIIPGNHERSRLPLGLLPFFNDNLNLFVDPRSYLFEKNGILIKITGFPYIRHKARTTFSETLKKALNNSISNNTTRYDYSILVVHQLLAGSRTENYTFRRGYNVIPILQVLRKFNYIACGHVHRFQFLYDTKSPFLKSTNKFYSAEQDPKAYNWHFDYQNSSCTQFPNPIIAYAGSLERVSFMERNEPKGYLIGELKPSNNRHKKMNLKIRFHELSAVKMMHKIWDLSKQSEENYINQTLEEMIDHHSTHKSNQNKSQGDLTGIIRIGIKGQRLHNNTLLNFLKEEAKRLGYYLTIRGAPDIQNQFFFYTPAKPPLSDRTTNYTKHPSKGWKQL